MGIFADFLASRPMTIETERIARRELEALRDQGDADAPGDFIGRTGWAILKVLTLTDQDAPPVQGNLLGFRPQDIDYQRALISPDTAKVIANQIAIDDGNRALELDLLIHLDQCPTKPGKICISPAPVTSAITLSSPIDDYNAASLGLSDGADVDSWASDVGTDFLTVGNSNTPFSPTFEAAAFNGLGGVVVDQDAEPAAGDVTFYDSNDSVQPFAGRTGTFVIVWEPRVILTGAHTFVETPDGTFFVATNSSGNRPFFVNLDGVGPLETPAVNLTLNDPQLFLWWRDDDRLEFRRNGVAKTGRTLPTNPVPAIAAPMMFFGQTAEANSMSGAIARVIRWDRVLTNQEHLNIEAELTGLYF